MMQNCVDMCKRLLATRLQEGQRFEVGAPGLLKPFLSQIWMSVRGWGRIKGLGCCAPDRGSGIGG